MPTTPDLIHAPWSAEQVTALNAFQHHGRMHPFTCGATHDSGQSPVLVATHSGWVCPDPQCVYRQDWAHAFMAEPAARFVGQLASLAMTAGRALLDEKRHYEIACEENAHLRDSVEAYRLALSTVLGLGTGAPWDAIHDRATEIAAASGALARIREKATEWTALAPPDDWGDTPQDTALADTGRYLLRLIDNPAAAASRGDSVDDDHSCAESGCSGEPGPLAAAEAPTTTKPETRRCPHCGEDLTTYAKDDLVWRTGDDRPYCSGECVIAAHRAAGVGQDGAQPQEPPVVAYRSPGGHYLYCTRHTDELGASWTPLLSDDLPDGGLCAHSGCGVDVLIPQQGAEK